MVPNITRARNGRNVSFMVNKPFKVAGDGHWSNTCKEVFVTKITTFVGTSILKVDEDTGEPNFGTDDLRVYFKTSTWPIKKYGLIYTDSLFEEEVKTALIEHGVPEDIVAGVAYSEQGMQGTNFVSFDAYEFEKYARTLFNFPKNPKPIKPPTDNDEFISLVRRVKRVLTKEYPDASDDKKKEECKSLIAKILKLQQSVDPTKKVNQKIINYVPPYTYE